MILRVKKHKSESLLDRHSTDARAKLNIECLFNSINSVLSKLQLKSSLETYSTPDLSKTLTLVFARVAPSYPLKPMFDLWFARAKITIFAAIGFSLAIYKRKVYDIHLYNLDVRGTIILARKREK